MPKKYLLWIALWSVLFGFIVLNQRPQATAVAAPDVPLAAISLTGGVYTQNFDTLAISGTSETVPSGWAFSESGSNANTTYTAGTGSDNAGNTYSFGATGSTERAFGGLLSGSLIPTIGAEFQNNSGATIVSLAVAYNCEQWRLGATGRTDRMDFQYSTSATSLVTGTWTDVDSLDCSSTITSGTVGALDGNINRTAISNNITGLSIANGTTFWLRWTDFNAAGADDGLAVDDFSLTPNAGGDIPPTVTSTSPANGASNVSTTANLSVTFSEPVTVSGAWFEIVCGSSGTHAVADTDVTGGPTTFTINPDNDFIPAESCTTTIFAAQVADQDDTPDNMAADYSWSFTIDASAPIGSCDDGNETRIHTIQGSGASSPLVGQSGIVIEGVVVGDFQGAASPTLRGFFVQEEDADQDGDSTTSEGIFIFDATFTVDVAVGDLVRVRGSVAEFPAGSFSMTQLDTLTDILICSSGSSGLVTPTAVGLPLATGADWERYEGMLVTFSQDLVVTEHFNLGRFGELLLTTDDRLFQYTHTNAPNVAGYAAFLESIAANSILLDDTISQQNPDPIAYPNPGLTYNNTLRIGDHITGLTGVLEQRFSTYRIQPQQTGNVTITAANLRPLTPGDPGGGVRVASYNVLNYFTTLGTGNNCGPLSNMGCRGANNAFEFGRQRTKIINAIIALDADVVGLMEIENHASDAALQDLVQGLNDAAGVGTYARIATGAGPLGSDAIKVALIYQPAQVTPVGSWVTLSNDAFADRNRQPLVQTFASSYTGEQFTVVVNHLKSKGSSCATASGVFPADPDLLDGQANCNLTRTMAADQLVTWLGGNPTGSSAPTRMLIMGDLNAYAREDPIAAIIGAGYQNLIYNFLGDSAYSFVFDGQSGYLDHALATNDLTELVTGVVEWHINADEPRSLDYNEEFKSAGQIIDLYGDGPFRSSDHDPVLIGLFAYDLSSAPASYGYAWHAGDGELRLGSEWSADRTPSADTSDGVARTPGVVWTPGSDDGSVDVTITGCPVANCFLNAWVDWDNNGTFDSGEEIFTNQFVSNGSQTLTFAIPASPACFSDTPCHARFRLTETADDGMLLAPLTPVGATGGAITGEVEDYVWNFTPTAVTLQQINVTSGVANWRLLSMILVVFVVGALGLVLVSRRRIA